MACRACRTPGQAVFDRQVRSDEEAPHLVLLEHLEVGVLALLAAVRVGEEDA